MWPASLKLRLVLFIVENACKLCLFRFLCEPVIRVLDKIYNANNAENSKYRTTAPFLQYMKYNIV